MSDCSMQAFKPKLPREHYLDGYRDGISDSVKSWEPPYNEFERRCQQLEQVARELFDEYRRLLIRHSAIAGRISVMRDFRGAGGFREQLEALGVDVNAD